MSSIWGTVRDLFSASKYGSMTDAEIALKQQQEMTDYNAQVQKDYNEYITKNQMGWQMEGLQNAGLNPVLAATGGINGTTSAGAVQQGHVPTPTANGITSAKAITQIATAIAGIATKNPKMIAAAMGSQMQEKHYNNTYKNNKFYK